MGARWRRNTSVYEKVLGAALCATHGVEAEWYLKLQLIEGLYGKSVFFVSFHQPEHPFTKKSESRKRGGQS